jgi:uncharacterized membrane protein (UPF0127 family)
MMAVNSTRNTILAENMARAESFLARLKGLLGRAELPPGRGLLLEPCRSVHTCFMRFPIDVIFLNMEGKIIYLVAKMKPYKATPYVKRACRALELPAGILSQSGSVLGDTVNLLGGNPYEKEKQRSKTKKLFYNV